MSVFLSHGLAMVLDCLVKGTLLLLMAVLTCLLLRRSSAATRHLVWSTALGGILLLPLLSLSLPRWQVALPSAALKSTPISPVVPAPSTIPTDPWPIKSLPTPNEGTFPVSAPAIPVQPVPRPKQSHSLLTLIHFSEIGVVVWFLGATLVLGQFAVGLRRINKIRKAALPLDASTLAIAEAARQQFGIRLSIKFIRASEGSSVAIPITWGVLHPVVLVPPQSNKWSEDCLRAALLHEMAHISRRDWPTQIMTRIACTIYWWHPLVWWVARQARAESERACDDLVLGTGMRATDYAQRLVEVVRSLPAGTRFQTAAIAMAQPLEVEARITAVLATGRDRSRLSRKILALTVMTVVVLLLPLSALRPEVHAQATATMAVPQGQDVTRRQERGILEFVYLKDVATEGYPSRPLILNQESGGRTGHISQFVNTKTGKTFRDAKQIQDVFDQVLWQGGYKKRPGTKPYLIPLPLSIDVPTRNVFFTAAQRLQADKLEKEKEAWDDLIENSPLITTDADIEPRTTASLNSQRPPIPIVDIHFTPEGAKKMTAFTTAHPHEIMGIILDGGLLAAPKIEGLIQDEGQIGGGFHTLAEAQDLAKRLNMPTPLETVSPDYYHSVSPDGSEIIEMKGGATDTVPIAQSYSATLPNRYTVAITSVRQAVAKDGEWNMTGGPSWGPDGLPLAQDIAAKKDRSWGWRLNAKDGLAPYIVEYTIEPSSADGDLSEYQEFLGTSDPDWLSSFARHNLNASGGTGVSFFPKDAKTFSARLGVAVGPWQTVGTLPFHLTPAMVTTQGSKSSGFTTDVHLVLDDRPKMEYQDAQGHQQIVYFLGKERALNNVARRFVAVDKQGQVIPLNVSGEGSHGIEDYSFSFAAGSRFANYNPKVNLAKVIEFRIQTRPYQIVEFRNIQLQPRAGSPITESASTQAWRKKEETEIYNMRRISTVITQYTQDNDGKLPSLKTIVLLEKDLDPYLKQQDKYPDPTTHQPYLVRGHALFISPMTGKPYRLSVGLSNAAIPKIGSPAFITLFSDSPITRPDGTRWLFEAFADGHVKGRVLQ